MSGELKNFPPSELKLERLRRSGAIPFSEEVLLIGLAGGLLFCFRQMSGEAYYPLVSYFADTLSSASQLGSARSEQTTMLEKELREAAAQLLYYLFAVIAPIVVGVVLLGLLQTRCLVTPSAFSLRFGRLFSLSGFFLPVLAGRFASAMYRLLLAGVWIVVSWLILRYVFLSAELEATSDALGLRERLDTVLVHSGMQLVYLLLATFCFTSLLGVGTYFVTLLQYRRTHRMSRSEVEAEYREMEPAPEFQAARSEQQAEDLE